MKINFLTNCRLSLTLLLVILLFSGTPLSLWAASEVFVWTEQTNSGVRNWTSIDSSNDGTKLVAGNYNGNIYTSADGGVNWTEQTGSGTRSWIAVTSSADGVKLAAVDQAPGYIYTSADGGVNWTEHTNPGQAQWEDIDSSADGSKLIAVGYGGNVFVSLDSGANWVEKTDLDMESKDWESVAISSDGMKIFIGSNAGPLYQSVDGGTTWAENTNADERFWYGLSTSGDGSVIIGGTAGQILRMSSDGGVTWRDVSELGYGYWSEPGISNDGTIIVLADDGRAGSDDGYIYTSNDSGATWARNTDLGQKSWYGASVSGDGSRATVSAWGSESNIYTATSVRASVVSTGRSGSNRARSVPDAPELLIKDTTNTSVTLSGRITKGNGVTEAGFILKSLEGDSDKKNFDVAPLASFSSVFSGLLCGARYEARAYARNSFGTTYSDKEKITMLPCENESAVPLGDPKLREDVTKEKPTVFTPVFVRNLYRGVTGEDVRDLQIFLNSRDFTVAESGPGSPGNETNVFGPATMRALSLFQSEHGVFPAQGYFGPITRKHILDLGV